MKKIIYILVFLCFSLCYSQNTPEYDIYLMFDSSKKQIIISETKGNDYLSKFFHIPRVDDKKNYSFTYTVDKNGKLKKGLKGATSHGCCSITAIYLNKENEKKLVSIPKMENLITYNDYMSVEFKIISNIIRKANKVYIIDENEKKEDSIYYTAYEVKY